MSHVEETDLGMSHVEETDLEFLDKLVITRPSEVL